MEYRLLGNTGIEVSQLCLGTMTFGGPADEAESKKMFGKCRDAGVNFFDCANVYEKGRSEKILGKLMAGCREEVIITTKVYFPTGEDVNARGATHKHIRHAIEGSLRRLKTDYIDLYFLHRFDDITPLEETLRVLDDLVRDGKILYLGVSNFAAWQVTKALGISSANVWNQIECIQPMYNLAKRQAEVELLPMAKSENVGVISYSPLGGGLLTGKYAKGKKPKEGRLLNNKMYKERYQDPRFFEIAEAFSAFAESRGFSPISLGVSWVGAHEAVTAPIIGGRNYGQLKPALESVNIDMTDELRSEISALSPTPPSATDRNEEATQHNYGGR
ncbi:MAG: aldo/keto reductase [Candidatus Neomarinimicrobiota bacterium]|nr:aldo/keto reductase [Candidatus Neomarinimicrobiota bacterium]